MKNTIPLHQPLLGEKEIKAVIKTIRSGEIGGDGCQGQLFEEELKKCCQSKYALLTTSGTSALDMALLVLGVQPGDEVICPSFSFVSTANVIATRRAIPVFVDIEPNYYNLDPALLENAITEKTKAIICVHYAGVPCQMKEIMAIAKKYGLAVIEDAAHAIGSLYRGRPAGSLGDMGCFSFHQTKNITTGEGGAFLTGNSRYAALAEIMREKGTNRKSFVKGEVDKYGWVDLGHSYVISDVLAAIGYQQLKRLKTINSLRTKNARYLTKKLEKYAEVILPQVPDDVVSNWHIYAIRVKKRDWLIKELKKRGIVACFHFPPLHLSPFARKNLNYRVGDFPITEEVSNTLIRLPVYPQLTRNDLDRIVKAFDELASQL